jgi:hypothetical protein
MFIRAHRSRDLIVAAVVWMMGNILSVNPTTSLVHITSLPTVQSLIHPQIPVVLQMEQMSIVVRVFLLKTGEIRERLLHN